MEIAEEFDKRSKNVSKLTLNLPVKSIKVHRFKKEMKCLKDLEDVAFSVIKEKWKNGKPNYKIEIFIWSEVPNRFVAEIALHELGEILLLNHEEAKILEDSCTTKRRNKAKWNWVLKLAKRLNPKLFEKSLKEELDELKS